MCLAFELTWFSLESNVNANEHKYGNRSMPMHMNMLIIQFLGIYNFALYQGTTTLLF